MTGSTEWVVRDSRLARHELTRLRAAYARASGLAPRVISRPPGVTTGGQIDVETGQVYVWNDNPPAFQEGFLVEELHHYFQLEEQCLIGVGDGIERGANQGA